MRNRQETYAADGGLAECLHWHLWYGVVGKRSIARSEVVDLGRLGEALSMETWDVIYLAC